MSKQIAILIDNSGSMFQTVGAGNANDKIVETADGADVFLQNLLDEHNSNPGSDFAISVHRFAASYEVLAGGAQTDTSQGSFAADVAAMQAGVSTITDQVASQAAVGNLTDMYDAVRQTSDFLAAGANQPGFGAPDAKVIFLFSDGLQTISHDGNRTKAGYESEQGVDFADLLAARGIRLVAWGIGADALASALRELSDDAVDPSSASEFHGPGSYTKVLFPESEDGTFANCDTLFTNVSSELVSDNGILRLAPVGGSPSGLLWEQFALPRREVQLADPAEVFVAPLTHVPTRLVDHADFEVEVDGASRELLLGLVQNSRAEVALEATSPSSATFVPGGPGTRTVATARARMLKIPDPEEGTWRVRVTVDPRTPTVLDLMARGIRKELDLYVEANPFRIPEAGEVEVVARLHLDGKPARGELCATAHVLGGGSFELARRDDGTFAGPAEISRPGITPIRVEVEGKLEEAGSVRRFAFAEALLGRPRDPRFTLRPSVYAQGGSYSVDVELLDGRFGPATQIRFGDGIRVTSFQRLGGFTGRAEIEVDADAFPGERQAVTFHPFAESLAPVTVVAAKDDGKVGGRICCLRYDAAGRLVAVVLCDGREICVRVHDERLEQLLEKARDCGLEVEVALDRNGCLTGVSICR